MYFTEPRSCYFIFLGLEAVTCMCTYSSIFSKPWGVFYVSLDTGYVGRVSWPYSTHCPSSQGWVSGVLL